METIPNSGVTASTEASTCNNSAPAHAQTPNEAPAKTGVSKVITIRKSLNLPPVGVNNGIFLDINVLPEDSGPGGKKRQLLKLDVQLEALDIHDKPFVVSKCYNLYARGLKTLNQDLRDWCGQDLIAGYDEKFDAGVFLGLPVRVTIHKRQQGKQWITSIIGFHPVEVENPPTQGAA